MTSDKNYKRGLWVWNTDALLLKSTYANNFFKDCAYAKITDIFLYMPEAYCTYVEYVPLLKEIIKRAKKAQMAVWALDGSRAYFSDAEGISGLITNVDAVINYNLKVSDEEKFIGFQIYCEPEDSEKYNVYSFHDDIPNSQLNTSGGGTWQVSQEMDREMLLRDWLNMHKVISDKLKVHNLFIGAALPSWTDNYYGESLDVTWNGEKKSAMKHFVEILDTFNIMSYQTNTTTVISRVKTEMEYASTQTVNPSILIFAGLETVKRRGSEVTYGDNIKKRNKTAVLYGISKIELTLMKYKAFGGINIHDYDGWRALPS